MHLFSLFSFTCFAWDTLSHFSAKTDINLKKKKRTNHHIIKLYWRKFFDNKKVNSCANITRLAAKMTLCQIILHARIEKFFKSPCVARTSSGFKTPLRARHCKKLHHLTGIIILWNKKTYTVSYVYYSCQVILTPKWMESREVSLFLNMLKEITPHKMFLYFTDYFFESFFISLFLICHFSFITH